MKLRRQLVAMAAVAVCGVGCGDDFSSATDAGSGGASGAGATGSGGASGGGAGGTSGGAGGSGGVGGTGGSVGGTGPIDAGPDSIDPCTVEQPDFANGIGVAPSGTDSGACGAAGSPCKTLKQALANSVASGKSRVFVAEGTYEEDGVSLPQNVTVQGAWSYASGAWTRICTDTRAAAVLIRPVTSNTTLRAENLGGTARLEALTVSSRTTAAGAGESLYGIVVLGSTSILELDEVEVEVAKGGDGAPGGTGSQGGAPASSCSAGTGANGNTGPGGTGAPAGTFGASGYVPSSGTSGGTGTSGSHGTAGGNGTCYACKTPCDDCTSTGAQICGDPGKPGCGGGGGGSGTPGKGGGSSVGVFLWGAALTATNGSVTSGAGGKGGPGGGGGPGGSGSSGQAGAGKSSPTCYACTIVSGSCFTSTPTAPGGTPGGVGGTGGPGGTAGGGAGGHSYAIYAGNGSVPVITGTQLNAGAPGGGGGTGPQIGAPGVAKPLGP